MGNVPIVCVFHTDTNTVKRGLPPQQIDSPAKILKFDLSKFRSVWVFVIYWICFLISLLWMNPFMLHMLIGLKTVLWCPVVSNFISVFCGKSKRHWPSGKWDRKEKLPKVSSTIPTAGGPEMSYEGKFKSCPVLFMLKSIYIFLNVVGEKTHIKWVTKDI